MVFGYCSIHGLVNKAVMVRLRSMVTTQSPLPGHFNAGLQPMKVDPISAEAERVTSSIYTKKSSHPVELPVEQEIPAGVLVTMPDPPSLLLLITLSL